MACLLKNSDPFTSIAKYVKDKSKRLVYIVSIRNKPDCFVNLIQEKFGVCYHPKHGGWMSLDGVLIFKDVLCPDLPKRDPPDVVDTQKKRVELLEQFNIPDWSFRDLLSTPERKYFEEHIEYLSTEDRQKRRDIVQRIRSRDKD